MCDCNRIRGSSSGFMVLKADTRTMFPFSCVSDVVGSVAVMAAVVGS